MCPPNQKPIPSSQTPSSYLDGDTRTRHWETDPAKQQTAVKPLLEALNKAG